MTIDAIQFVRSSMPTCVVPGRIAICEAGSSGARSPNTSAPEPPEHLNGVLEPSAVAVADEDQRRCGQLADRPVERGHVELFQFLDKSRERQRIRRSPLVGLRATACHRTTRL